MAPKRAVAYILSFELPQDEAYCLIECDVRGKSRVEVAETLHVSPEYVKTRRRRAYSKIADGIKRDPTKTFFRLFAGPLFRYH